MDMLGKRVLEEGNYKCPKMNMSIMLENIQDGVNEEETR